MSMRLHSIRLSDGFFWRNSGKYTNTRYSLSSFSRFLHRSRKHHRIRGVKK